MTLDWWGVGIIIYELLFGKTPFFAEYVDQLQTNICEGQIRFPAQSQNMQYSNTVVDLIIRLLDKNKETRLGAANDSLDVLSHPWFQEFSRD